LEASSDAPATIRRIANGIAGLNQSAGLCLDRGPADGRVNRALDNDLLAIIRDRVERANGVTKLVADRLERLSPAAKIELARLRESCPATN
jgi:hypothetical protein